jgi:hypothetical protein
MTKSLGVGKKRTPLVLLAQNDSATPIVLSPEEGPAESELAVAQDLWGVGNLSPLDDLFGSAALMSLAVTPTSIFGVIGCHLGARLKRYSTDTGVWIDVFTNEPPLSLQDHDNARIKLHRLNDKGRTLAKSRFSALAVLQASKNSHSLQATYGECANGMKRGGQLFSADLMRLSTGEACSLQARTDAKAQSFPSLRDHKNALAAAQLSIQNEHDLTGHLMAAIRHGFLKGTNMLGILRKLDEPWKSQRLSAFCSQLQTWLNLFQSLQDGEVTAKGLHAVKR